MRTMESRSALARQSLGRAVAISLLFHAAVLFIKLSSPSGPSGSVAGQTTQPGDLRPSLSVTLARPLGPTTPAVPVPPPPPAPPVEAAPKPPTTKSNDSWVKGAEQKTLTAPVGPWAARSWSSAERAEMEKFLNEQPAPAKPASSGELAQRALAMARQLGRVAPEETAEPPAKSSMVEPFSLEMYFDAFVRKMNRSAAFVKSDPRTHGSRKALVEIALNPDGSLKSYRVLRSADQQAEIAYIKSVIDRAVPFSAFPPDIRDGTDALTILMCIMPAHGGEGGGFSRSFGGQDCRD
jgi:hypothetical protein